MSEKSKKLDLDLVRQRLSDAITQKGISKRSVSLASGNGPGYVHSILSEGKEPTVTNLAAVCDVVGVSLYYILYGVEVSPETEAIIKKLEENPNARDGILALLTS